MVYLQGYLWSGDLLVYNYWESWLAAYGMRADYPNWLILTLPPAHPVGGQGQINGEGEKIGTKKENKVYLPIKEELMTKINLADIRFVEAGPNTFGCWVIEFDGWEIWINKENHRIISMGKAINRLS